MSTDDEYHLDQVVGHLDCWGAGMKYDYAATYRRMTDDELMRLVSERGDLVPEASVALDKELQRRGLVGVVTHGANLVGEGIRLQLRAMRGDTESVGAGDGPSSATASDWPPRLREKVSGFLLLVAGADSETRKKRILTACAVAIAAICLWVPWEGYYGPKDKMNPYFLGYGFLWAPPEAPHAFVTYERLLAPSDDGWVDVAAPGAYQSPNRQGLVKPRGYVPSQAFAQPNIDYGRILLEIAAILAVAFVAWLLAMPGEAAS